MQSNDSVNEDDVADDSAEENRREERVGAEEEDKVTNEKVQFVVDTNNITNVFSPLRRQGNHGPAFKVSTKRTFDTIKTAKKTKKKIKGKKRGKHSGPQPALQKVEKEGLSNEEQ